MRNIDWSRVPDATDFPRVKPGGYIVRIAKVEDDEDKECLWIYYDFVEGELKGYYAQLYKAKNFWGGKFVRSYKESALPFFKGFKTAVEESNPGYSFKNNPQSLVKKYVGIVIGEEEYWNRDGEKKVRTYVANTLSGKRIRSGDFKVPELKKVKDDDSLYNDLKNKVADVFADTDEDVPFPDAPPHQQEDILADRYDVDGELEDDNDVLPF